MIDECVVRGCAITTLSPTAHHRTTQEVSEKVSGGQRIPPLSFRGKPGVQETRNTRPDRRKGKAAETCGLSGCQPRPAVPPPRSAYDSWTWEPAHLQWGGAGAALLRLPTMWTGVHELSSPPGGRRRHTCTCVARRWGVEAKDASGRRMQPIAEREPSGVAAAVRSVAGWMHARPVGANTCAQPILTSSAPARARRNEWHADRVVGCVDPLMCYQRSRRREPRNPWRIVHRCRHHRHRAAVSALSAHTSSVLGCDRACTDQLGGPCSFPRSGT
jgi:hypothetical protein